MAESNKGTSSKARSASKTDRKKQKFQDNPYLRSYAFTEDVDKNYLKTAGETDYWSAPPNDAIQILPRPPWLQLNWGPLLQNPGKGLVKAFIQPVAGSGSKKGEKDDRSPEEVRGGLYMEWKKASPKVKVSGSGNLALLKTAEIGPAQVVPFLGFPDHSALVLFGLTEDMLEQANRRLCEEVSDLI